MNALKKNGGFTLVELIVVIAILAILAGVAVPAYSGYITKANKSADDQALLAIETAVASAVAMEGKNATKIVVTSSSSIKATIDSAEVDLLATANVTAYAKNFQDFYGKTAPTLKTGTTATWESNKWTITSGT